MSDLDIQFNDAARNAVAFAHHTNDAEKLDLYALYKQATEGDNRARKPGIFDIIKAAKWRAWSELAGTPQNVAKQRYIDLVTRLRISLRKEAPSRSATSAPHPTYARSVRRESTTSADEMTLDDCLRERASGLPSKDVFVFLDANGEQIDRLNYAELDDRARVIAAAIQNCGPKGQRVLLLFEPGLLFASAFYGCMYAGAVAVPAYPPDPTRFERTLPRLQTIAADSSPAIVLTSASILALARQLLSFAPDLAKLEWISIEEIMGRENAGTYQEPALSPQDIAFIQYTSGSTSTPKGVVVSHRNVLTNARMMQRAAKQGMDRVIVSWLPQYHDLGLMTGIILPVVAGARSILMSPLDFLKRPALWMSSIHRYQATDTSAPNFALDLCVQKVPPEERAQWDLRSLKICLVGAEPVRHASLERFVRTFERHGLSRQSMLPGYGLAEAVVGVSCARMGDTWKTAFVDADELAQNRVVEVEPTHPSALALVASGSPIEEVTLEIVNPETCEPVASGQVGEVWITGLQVAMGYWQRDIESEQTFKARLAHGDERDWLRTGDFGFIRDAQLYITGRIKDVIILRGRNHYPQDVEITVELSHPRVRQGSVIAFGIEHEGAEGLVLVAEVDLRQLSTEQQKRATLDEIVTAIGAAVGTAHGLPVRDVALLKPRTIDKTSSGKLARQSCRQRYLSGTLDAEFIWKAEGARPTPRFSYAERTEDSGALFAQPMAEALCGMSLEERRSFLGDYMEKEIGALTGGSNKMSLRSSSRFDEIGMDSLSTMELIGRVERDTHVKMSIAKFLNATSLSALVENLLDAMDLDETPADDRRATSTEITASTASIGSARLKGGTWPKLTQAMALQDLSIPAPIFCIGGLGGTVPYLTQWSSALSYAKPLIVFQAVGIDGSESPLGSVEEMAQRYLKEMKAVQPHGPYVLAGHSFGGLVAYEMAQRLVEQGDSVEHLFLVDTIIVEDDKLHDEDESPVSEQTMAMYELFHMFRRFSGKGSDIGIYERLSSMSDVEQQHWLSVELSAEGSILPGSAMANVMAVYLASFSAMKRYRPLPYAGPVTLFQAKDGFPAQSLHPARKIVTHLGEPSLGWQRFCRALRVVFHGGDHFSIVLHPNATALADAVISTVGNTTRLGVGLHQLVSTKHSQKVGRPIEVSRHGVSFDPFHPALFDDPYPILHQLREQAPVYRDATSTWWVTRYVDVSAGLRDKRFSVDTRNAAVQDRENPDIAGEGVKPSLGSAWFRRQEELPLARLYNNFMLFIDPPRHQKLRRFFSPLFESSNMRRWKNDIDGRVDDLVSDMRMRRDPDVVRDLALPLPVSVISEMLGTPQHDAFILQSWAHELFRGFDPMLSGDAAQHISAAADDFTRYMNEHIERRRKSPKRDDMLGLLLEANEGESLTTDELAANCMLLFAAGFETTTSVIANSVLALLRNPDQLHMLRKNPELTDNAVEEFLRYDGALRMAMRTALEDVDIGGSSIPRGDSVVFVLPAANRDPDAFPDPDRLDVTRNAKHHVAFAHGIHYCLGAPLAKLEIQSAISALVRHDFMLVPGTVKWRESMIFRCLDQLRIAFL